MDDVIKLLAQTSVKDEYGVDRASYTAREVFCKVQSVSRAEFFEAGRSGLNPEYRFRIFAADYDGESIVEYRSKTYAVYRTYRQTEVSEVNTRYHNATESTDYIELYVERKGGTNGKNNNG